jgi:hypothetical protein
VGGRADQKSETLSTVPNHAAPSWKPARSVHARHAARSCTGMTLGRHRYEVGVPIDVENGGAMKVRIQPEY